jgi:hypothetical protein
VKNYIITLFVIGLSLSQSVFGKEKIVTMDPDEIQISDYMHEKLPQEMLSRIKITTDTFEIVDGISYANAVDLYKRDLDPESDLVIWEEMARVYNMFCESRCETDAERKEVYRALLLRSMFTSQESISKLQPTALSIEEAKSIISQYRLKAQPIVVYKK